MIVEKPCVGFDGEDDRMTQDAGKHLLIDTACRHAAPLVSVDLGNQCLIDIVGAIEMTMVLPPVSVKFPKSDESTAQILASLESEGLGDSRTAEALRQELRARAHLHDGYSSFVRIAESHLSLHTFPESQFLSFDCYSCKSFDHDRVIGVLEEIFGLESPRIQILSRNSPATFDDAGQKDPAATLLAHRAMQAIGPRVL